MTPPTGLRTLIRSLPTGLRTSIWSPPTGLRTLIRLPPTGLRTLIRLPPTGLRTLILLEFWFDWFVVSFYTLYFITLGFFIWYFVRLMFCRRDLRVRHNRVRVLVGSIDKFDTQIQNLFMMSEACLDPSPPERNNLAKPQSSQRDKSKLFICKDKIANSERQGFPQWKVAREMNSLFALNFSSKRNIIFFQPIGEFPSHILDFKVGGIPLLQFLCDFLKTFFHGMEVETQEEISVESLEVTSRYHKVTGKKQVLVTDVLTKLKKFLKHRFHYIVGMSWTDLYPSDDLNFVLGEASYKQRSAVFSFGRYEPQCYHDNKAYDDIVEVDGEILWKLIKVMTHEVCHTFGLAHCVFFECAMNESSSVKEAMSQPLFLCPICLRKLQHLCDFNIRTRYQSLLLICHHVQKYFPTKKMEASIVWLESCLQFLNNERSDTVAVDKV
ncbi:archaemetzincin-1-like [Saccoglossus kowalevskii]